MTNFMMHRTRKASSFPAGMAIAAAVSIVITLLLSAGIAIALQKEWITWQQAGYWIMGMLFAASFIGGKCAFASLKRQRALVSVLSGILYWGILLSITALFFGGNFEAIGETGAIIAAGCSTSALLIKPGAKNNRGKPGRGYR